MKTSTIQVELPNFYHKYQSFLSFKED